MLIENFDRIYGEIIYTTNTAYEVCKDSILRSSYSHTIRLNPIKGGNQDTKAFTIVISMLDVRIACGIYIDTKWDAIEVFDLSKLDLKRMDTFKKLLSAKIQNHE